MTNQLSLDQALIARDRAMNIVDFHAGAEWKDAALWAVYETAAAKVTFTADDVWERIPLHLHTHDNRALGPVMVRAAKNGWIEATDRVQRTSRASNHARPLAVWRSNL